MVPHRQGPERGAVEATSVLLEPSEMAREGQRGLYRGRGGTCESPQEARERERGPVLEHQLTHLSERGPC